MKLVGCLILALSRNVFAQFYISGPDYGAAYCGQHPCGQPYPGVGMGMPLRPSPCVSHYPMQCVPVPQQYGAISCICSTSSGVYQGGDCPYHPPLSPQPPPQPPSYGGGVGYRPPPPRPARWPKCRLECVNNDYHYFPWDMKIEWPEYDDYYHGYGNCRRVCYSHFGDRGR